MVRQRLTARQAQRRKKSARRRQKRTRSPPSRGGKLKPDLECHIPECIDYLQLADEPGGLTLACWIDSENLRIVLEYRL